MLVLLLRIFIFATTTLWSLLTRMIFSAVAHSLVLFIQAFKLPGEAAQGGFQQVAEIIRACFEYLLDLIVQAVSYIISTVFDVLTNSITESIAVTGSVVGDLAESLKSSFEEALNTLSDLFNELSDMISSMISDMVTDLWENYKEAVGYVTENA